MDTEAAAAAPVALFKKRGAKGKANIRKRPATPPLADSDSDYSSSEDESGQRVKRRKKTAVVTASSKAGGGGGASKELTASAYTADRSAPLSSANDATKQSNWYDEHAADALPAKTLLGSSSAAARNAPDGTYKGLANQTSFITKNPDAPQRSVGPVKAATNIRTITVMDFAPDVCKDYKKTGFCGFGDNCKYLHSREDVKQGWQLDKDWDITSKGKTHLGGTVVANANRDAAAAAAGGEGADEEAMLERIPFKCIICEGDYREPVVTRCGHYFCEPCALQRYRKDPACAACGAGTNGVFNSAKKLKKLLEKKRDRAEKKKQQTEGEEEEEVKEKN
ncbi:hypothetical protein ARSEF4850_000684 [Beauveria asiatica]